MRLSGGFNLRIVILMLTTGRCIRLPPSHDPANSVRDPRSAAPENRYDWVSQRSRSAIPSIWLSRKVARLMSEEQREKRRKKEKSWPAILRLLQMMDRHCGVPDRSAGPSARSAACSEIAQRVLIFALSFFFHFPLSIRPSCYL